jgi:O-antigen/teichoic acid export membrane protein
MASEEGVGRAVGNREAQRVAGGAAIALVGGGVSFVLSIAYQVVIARRLGASGFGVFILALAISNVLAEGSDLGLDYGLLRFGGIARGKRDWGQFRSVLRSAVVGSLLAGSVAAAVLAFGSGIVAHAFHKTTLASVIVALALSVPLVGTTEVLRAGLRAMGNATRPVVSSSLIRPGVQLLTGAWIVMEVPSAPAVAWAFTATQLVVVVLTAVMLWRILPRGDRRTHRPEGLFRFSVPMMLNRVLLYSNNQTEVVILGILAPAVTLGIFGVTRRLSVLLSSLLASVSILFNPMVADLHHSGRMQELDRVFKTATRWLFTLGLPVFLIEALFGSAILNVFGHDFRNGATALAILAFGQLVNVGTGTVSNLQAMAGYARLTLLNALLFLSLSIALDLLLIPPFGLLGAAIANSSSLVTVNVLRLWQIRRNLGLTPYDRSFLRPIAAASAAGAAAWVLPLPTMPVLAAFGIRAAVLGGVYLASLVALGFEEVDREIAAAAISKLRRRNLETQGT